MKKEKFNAVKALTEPKEQSFNPKELLKALTEMYDCIKINSVWDKEGLSEMFFKANRSLIKKKIISNKDLTAAREKLSQTYSADSKEFDIVVMLTNVFIELTIEMNLSTEIKYLIHLKEIYAGTPKKKIEGEALNLDMGKGIITINEKPFDGLIRGIGLTVYLYSTITFEQNNKWREEYIKLFQQQGREKLLTPIHTINKKNKWEKGKIGRPGRFKDEQDFHKAVRSIPNWKSLNKTQIAKALRYASLSGLNELLKINEWSLPK
ncbi:MAG: hypothetical protein M0P61_14700 [Ignavibacteriaceae bacterium]|nr:hypothetical protein [Ignavibacteriaceae bacterium]